MTFAWLSYVELASRLLRGRELDIEEAYLRASISRAYYRLRNVADYETSAVVTLEEAENAYDLAASMGQRVQAL